MAKIESDDVKVFYIGERLFYLDHAPPNKEHGVTL